MIVNDNIRQMHGVRSSVYVFCRKMFSMQPDKEFYDLIEKFITGISDMAEAGDNENMKQGVNGLKEFISRRNSLSGSKLEEFDLETMRSYTSIICLPYVAPQEESYYTSSEHLLGQESHDDMAVLMNKYNISLTDKVRHNFDHIIVELEFMAYLSKLCSEEISMDKYEEAVKEQYDFHINHFDKWIYEFFNKVINYNAQENVLYKYLAYFAFGYLQEDKLFLKELLEGN